MHFKLIKNGLFLAQICLIVFLLFFSFTYTYLKLNKNLRLLTVDLAVVRAVDRFPKESLERYTAQNALMVDDVSYCFTYPQFIIIACVPPNLYVHCRTCHFSESVISARLSIWFWIVVRRLSVKKGLSSLHRAR